MFYLSSARRLKPWATDGEASVRWLQRPHTLPLEYEPGPEGPRRSGEARGQEHAAHPFGAIDKLGLDI